MHIRYILIPVLLYFSIRVFAAEPAKPILLAETPFTVRVDAK